MNNFKCPNCDQNFYIPQYSIKIIDYKTVYNSKTTGKRITCPRCNNLDIEYIDKPGDYKTLELGKFSMRSVDERHEHLKKRSHAHFEREIKDKQIEINRNANLQTLG